MQKFTQQKFQGIFNLMKYDYKAVTPFYDNKKNLTTFKIMQNKNLITVSVNGKISVEKGGNLKETGRYYGVDFVDTIRDIVSYYKSF